MLTVLGAGVEAEAGMYATVVAAYASRVSAVQRETPNNPNNTGRLAIMEQSYRGQP